MFDEPSEDPTERAIDPATKAKDKSDEFRMHAELFAVFEGPRKFDAELKPLTDADLAREIQRTMGKLEKAKSADSPVLPEPVTADAKALLTLCDARDLSTNDYHVHRRPGEVMITRWLKGDEVETYYTRLQAHFDAAMGGFKEDERQALEWQKDPKTLAYLEALEAVDVKMAERYLRDPIKQLGLLVLSTQAADELNIAYLADYVMSVTPADIVGPASAPPDDAPTERDLTWFFKLFSLRGFVDNGERMCFFAYLQKADDEDW